MFDNRVFTGYYDHTGEALFEGDRCSVDSGHSSSDDSTGKIIYITGKGFYFKYDDDGDEVLLHNIYSDLEKIKGANK